MREDMVILAVQFHRNGIAGESFYTVLFTYQESSRSEKVTLFGTLFQKPGHLAVFDVSLLTEVNARILNANTPHNFSKLISWRCECVESKLRLLLKEKGHGWD